MKYIIITTETACIHWSTYLHRAMLFLQECTLLKIEDILPCFPDFVTIEHFKVHTHTHTHTHTCMHTYDNRMYLTHCVYMCVVQDAICSSLTDYNAHIDDLKTEMQGATDSAKNIRSDIQDIRNKYGNPGPLIFCPLSINLHNNYNVLQMCCYSI